MNAQKVWEEYGSQLRNFLVAKVPTPEDADDLLQEILIKTHKNLNTLKEPEKFKSWLYQIARNTIIDYYRKQRPIVSDQDIRNSLPAQDPDPENPVLSELSQCVRPFLKQLPDKYREALEATDLEGRSQKDLAQELGLPHSTVKSRVQRGRSMLDDLFQECCTYQLDVRGNIMDFTDREDCC